MSSAFLRNLLNKNLNSVIHLLCVYIVCDSLFSSLFLFWVNRQNAGSLSVWLCFSQYSLIEVFGQQIVRQLSARDIKIVNERQTAAVFPLTLAFIRVWERGQALAMYKILGVSSLKHWLLINRWLLCREMWQKSHIFLKYRNNNNNWEMKWKMFWII